MLDSIKKLLGINDASKDEILMILFQRAINEAKNYTHNNSIKDYENVIDDMVIYNYNRLGTEGLDSESYSGVNFKYSSDYPESILRQLRSHRKVMVI